MQLTFRHESRYEKSYISHQGMRILHNQCYPIQIPKSLVSFLMYKRVNSHHNRRSLIMYHGYLLHFNELNQVISFAPSPTPPAPDTPHTHKEEFFPLTSRLIRESCQSYFWHKFWGHGDIQFRIFPFPCRKYLCLNSKKVGNMMLNGLDIKEDRLNISPYYLYQIFTNS